MPSIHLILCCPLLLLPPIPPSIRVFPNESTLCMRWPKYCNFSFSISPSNEYSGLISFRIDWFDLLAVQGTLRSLLQYHNSKATILWHSAFFIVQLSHPYLTTGKTIAFIIWTFVGKVMSLLFNMLFRFVTKFYSIFCNGLCAVLCLLTQLCLALCDPVHCSLPGSSVHGNSPGKNTGVGCHVRLQEIFPTQGLNRGLLVQLQVDSLLSEPPGKPIIAYRGKEPKKQ